MTKDIKGWEELYTISSEGAVYSKRKEKEVHIKLSNAGYFRVCLWFKSKNTTYAIHRLVAEAFVPNPDDKPIVNHIDGNKQNNLYTNLEWVTREENEKHASDNKLKAFGFRNNKTKLSEEQVEEIRTKRLNGSSIKDLVLEYKMGFSQIYRIIKNESRK